MNLKAQYKRLFEGRVSSNDKSLLSNKILSEDINKKSSKAYGKVYDLTEDEGDEILEELNQYIEQAGLEAAYEKFLDETPLTSKEDADLADVMMDLYNEYK